MISKSKRWKTRVLLFAHFDRAVGISVGKADQYSEIPVMWLPSAR